MKTGGLKDTVKEFDINTGQGSGILFAEHNTDAFKNAVDRALILYKNVPAYKKLRDAC